MTPRQPYNETVAMLVYQANFVRVQIFSYQCLLTLSFFCLSQFLFKTFVRLLTSRMKTLYSQKSTVVTEDALLNRLIKNFSLRSLGGFEQFLGAGKAGKPR